MSTLRTFIREALSPEEWKKIQSTMSKRGDSDEPDDPDKGRKKKVELAAKQMASFLQTRGNPAQDLANQQWLKDTYKVVMKRAQLEMTPQNLLDLHRQTAEMVGVGLRESDQLLVLRKLIREVVGGDALYGTFDAIILDPGVLPDLTDDDVRELHAKSAELAQRWKEENPGEEYQVDLTQKAIAAIEDRYDDVTYDERMEADEESHRRFMSSLALDSPEDPVERILRQRDLNR